MQIEVKNTSKKREKLYIFLIRAWCAGAVFFFIGWGTNAGSRNSIIDLVLLLSIAMGLFNSFVVNPSLKMIYNIGSQKEYKDMTVAGRILLRLKDVGLSLMVISFISWIYEGANRAAIVLFDLPKSAVFLPAEPIIFGLLYASIFILGGYLFKKVKGKVKAS